MEKEKGQNTNKHENVQLPREILHQTTAPRLALTVISTILCVFLINLGTRWFLDRYSPNTGYTLIFAKWNLLRSLPLGVDMLILGDSGGNQGVDPSVILEKLRLSSINLCTIGDAMVLDDAWMLQDYLDRYGTPKAVLIIHGYDIWSRDINISVLSKIPGSWWNQKPSVDLTLKDRIRVYLNRYVPTYTETRSLAHLLQNPWTAFRYKLHLDPSGFMIESEADPEQVVRDAQVHINHLDTVTIIGDIISQPNRKALEYIRELAEKYQFDVFLANGPLYQGLYDDPDFQKYYEVVRQTIGEVAATSDRLHYILNPPMTFSKDNMQSADHITAAAARDYTARIIEEIAVFKEAPASSE